MKDEKILTKLLKCSRCKNKLNYSLKYFICQKCRFRIYLPEGNPQLSANRSLGEKVFDFPQIYNLKINILNKLNRLNLSINSLIKGKTILDVGCGSYQARYNPNLAKFRIGIDPSANALREADKLYPKSFHLVSTAEKLPFESKSFDVTLLLFTLHHLSENDWFNAIKEARRVTKKTIIIYDHVLNESPLLSKLQLLYWKIFDGGRTYPQESDWTKVLSDFRIEAYKRVGSLFRHICFYVIKV